MRQLKQDPQTLMLVWPGDPSGQTGAEAWPQEQLLLCFCARLWAWLLLLLLHQRLRLLLTVLALSWFVWGMMWVDSCCWVLLLV
jgi:hypothetical protein